jgi:hypothetical protein
MAMLTMAIEDTNELESTISKGAENCTVLVWCCALSTLHRTDGSLVSHQDVTYLLWCQSSSSLIPIALGGAR